MVELKLAEQKFGGDPRPLGGGDPLVQVQKGQQNKKWWNKNLVGTLGYWEAGTPSASAKRSAEQKMAELKLAEQKFGGDPRLLGGGDPLVQVQKGQQNKKWWNKNLVGTLGYWEAGTPSASAKRSAEQKMAELKLAEQKFGGDPRLLGGGDPLVQVQKGQQNKKWWNKNLVGTLGYWEAGTPSASAKRSAEQKMAELKLVE